jgi:hypothetical protein
MIFKEGEEMRSFYHKWIGISMIATAIFMLPGCGGGGGGGNDNDHSIPNVEPTTIITKDNAEVVSGSAIRAAVYAGETSPDTPILYSIRAKKGNLSSFLQFTTMQAVDKALHLYDYNKQSVSLRSLEKRDSGTEQCPDGGTLSYSGGDTQGTLVFNHCKAEGTELHGKMTIAIDEEENPKTIVMENLSLKEDGGLSVFYIYATMKFENYGYYETPNKVVMEMTGSMEIPAYYDYLDIPTGHYEMNRLKISIGGLNEGYYTLATNGMLQTPCTSGWVEIKTLQTVKAPDSKSCPTEGKVEIIGKNAKTTVVFNADTSVDLLYDGQTLTSYPDCSYLPTDCTITK